MRILGIETSCDETSAAVVEDGRRILSNIIASQQEIHGPYGGVVPELACRRHVEIIDSVVHAALEKADVSKSELDLISVINGPGLIGALLIGVSFAKSMAYGLGIPLIGVHHIEAHLYGALMSHEDIPMPAIGLVISGGHTVLLLMRSVGEYTFLGSTVDDAVGEAFDKVASLLGLPYLGGPLLEKLARKGNPHAIEFPRAMLNKKGYDFSYSGLKTAVLYRVKGYGKKRTDADKVTEKQKADIAAAFQEAALEVLVKKTIKAARKFNAPAIVVGGGVSRNQRLRQMFDEATKSKGVRACFPLPELCTDNAAMAAGLAYHKFRKETFQTDLSLTADPNLRFLK